MQKHAFLTEMRKCAKKNNWARFLGNCMIRKSVASMTLTVRGDDKNQIGTLLKKSITLIRAFFQKNKCECIVSLSIMKVKNPSKSST